MTEDEFCTYCEWAEVEFIWGKSHRNWGWKDNNPPPSEDEKELKKYEGLFSF